MDRLSWSDSSLNQDEKSIKTVAGTRLYDGDKKTKHDDGYATMTNLRFLWRHPTEVQSLMLPLSSIVYFEKISAGFTSSPKIILHLHPLAGRHSSSNCLAYIKIGFCDGGFSDFVQHLEASLANKDWEKQPTVVHRPMKSLQSGILGIERSIQAKQKKTDQNIGMAFEDLKNLMALAKEMVLTSKSIANKLREQSTDFNMDETTQLRSYLMGLGIDDPVTKEAIGSSTDYYKQLAKEVVTILEDQIQHVGGTMLLSEAYCRINRVRGLHLISPEDLINACRNLNSLKLPLCLQTYQSGVYSLSLASLEEKNIVESIKNVMQEYNATGVSISEYAVLSGCSLLLAQERLHQGETHGVVVRDTSLEGVRFYPNLFWEKV